MASNNGAIKLVAGNSNPALAEGICAYIGFHYLILRPEQTARIKATIAVLVTEPPRQSSAPISTQRLAF
jgi:hypothetical protein